MKLDGAEHTLSIAVAGVAVTREAHGHSAVASERNEAEAVGDELVGEDGGIGFDLDEIDGDGGDLGDHHAPKRVGDADIGVAKLEFHEVVSHFANSHSRHA